MSKKKIDMLKNMFDNNDTQSLIESIIYETKDGYQLFGEYHIEKVGNKFIVSKNKTDLTEIFSNLKNAIVWTTMYKRDKLVDANRVKDLDILLEGAVVSYEIHKKLAKKAKDLDTKTLHIVKLQEDQMKQQAIIEELDRFVINAKNWQYRQFKEAAK